MASVRNPYRVGRQLPPVEPWYPAETVAALVGCCYETVWRRLAAGEIPGAYQLQPGVAGSSWRVPASALRQYVRGLRTRTAHASAQRERADYFRGNDDD